MGCEGSGFLPGVGLFGGYEAHGGIHDYGVARGSVLAMEDGFGDGFVVGHVASADAVEGLEGEAEVLRGEAEAFHCSVADGEDGGGGGDADFSHTVVRVDDETPIEAEFGGGSCDHFGGFVGPGSGYLHFGSGGVGEGAEEVESRAEFEFQADGLDVLDGSVEGRGEKETDAGALDAAGDDFGRGGGFDAEGFEKVGRAGTAGDGAVAVFGDADSGSGDDESGGGGDVEAGCGVASGAAGVEDGAAEGGDGELDGGGAHGAGEAGEFADGLSLYVEGGEERGGENRGGLAGEEGSHGGFGLFFGEGMTGGDGVEEFQVHAKV